MGEQPENRGNCLWLKTAMGSGLAAGGVGIFGGIFDPPHKGHCAVVNAAQRFFRFEKILIVPAGVPPHKQMSVRASACDRLAMVRAAFRQTQKIQIWEDEVRQAEPSYTIDTLTEIRRRFPLKEACLIIGSDNLTEIPTWRRYRAIVRWAVLCVARRPGFPLQPPAELAEARIIAFPLRQIAISSSGIRRAIAQRRPWKRFVPAAVAAYIERRGLYMADNTHGTATA